METQKERDSGIELLKIVAVFFIVICHVTHTLFSGENFNNLQFNDGYYSFAGTTSITVFILTIFPYLGRLGNLIFMISSSYFLSNSEKNNLKKFFKLGLNTIIISYIFFATFLIANVDLTKKEIIKSLFPITTRSNWFISTYLLFILIVPFLNKLIKKLNQKQLLRVSYILFIFYFVISLIISNHVNNIIVFIIVYFIVNYFKKYMENFWNNKKRCIKLLVLGIAGLIIFQFLTNFIALKFGSLQNDHWLINNNPILFIIAIPLFYLFKQMSFKSHFINTVSSLSLYVYLTHENVLFKTYTRVYILHYIYEKIGYMHIFIETLLYSLALFIAFTVISYIYKITIGKIVNIIIEKIFNNDKIKNICSKIENKIKITFNKIESKILYLS